MQRCFKAPHRHAGGAPGTVGPLPPCQLRRRWVVTRAADANAADANAAASGGAKASVADGNDGQAKISRRGALAAAAGTLVVGPGRASADGGGIVIPTPGTSETTSPVAGGSMARDIAARLDGRISEFTLPNGLHFVVMERHVAPIVACHTYANVGAWNEEEGQTGIAHLLEHMAFKGTIRIGTKDYRREAPLLDAMDEVFYEMRDAQAIGMERKVAQLSEKLKALQDAAAELTVPNAFGSLLAQQGAVGLNATTSHDQTRYFLSLPANRLELWFAMEAERFQFPVFRELYSEKKVVDEERRLRVETAPGGRFQQQFTQDALGNNYRRPVIGYPQDLAAIGRREVQAFFEEHYGPDNLTIAIVGDTTPDKVFRLATKYFGGWRPAWARAQPGASWLNLGLGLGRGTPVAAASPRNGAQGSEDEVLPRPQSFVSGEETSLRQASRSGPAVMLGYYRPPAISRDGVALEFASDILSAGRTSRMVSELVLASGSGGGGAGAGAPGSGRSALSASVIAAFPGERHSGLALVYAVPTQGVSLEQLDRRLRGCMARLADEGPTAAEMARVQRATTAGVLGTVQSNSSMASALCTYHVLKGSWRGLVDELEYVEAMPVEDVVRVTRTVFDDANCFTGYIDPAKA